MYTTQTPYVPFKGYLILTDMVKFPEIIDKLVSDARLACITGGYI